MGVARRRSLLNLLRFHEAAFLVLVAVTGALSGLSTYFWQQTSAESARVNNLSFLTEQIRGELFRQIQEVFKARLLDEPRAQRMYRRVNELFNELRRNSATEEEELAVQDMQQAYREIQRDMNLIFAAIVQVDGTVGVRILDPRFADQMVGRFEGPYTAFKTLLAKRQAILQDTMRRWTRYAPVGIPVVFLLAVLLVIMTSRIMRIDFVRPMATVKDGAMIISGGHLQHRIPVSGVAEVADIADSINRMAADLSRSRDALVEQERQAALGALVPVVAHNIRNPLASVRAAAQMLDESASQEEIRDGRDAIIATIDRLGRWVNTLVSYLHPLKPGLRRARVTDMVQAALAVSSARIQEKGLGVQRENWELDRSVLADPDLMEQALSGLVANAVDASPRGALLRVRLDTAAGALILRIFDSGPGIPFSPEPGGLEPGPSTKRFGTGLGIPVAFKICHSHGWELAFHPAAGGGTEVAIHIPVTAGDEAPA
ncbi:MAG: HAMP domain-containing protein [Gammaproteobacteria bacterium]|nr:HAMP domain-containing protein [Gammaproteobacteria bacterium]